MKENVAFILQTLQNAWTHLGHLLITNLVSTWKCVFEVLATQNGLTQKT